MFGSGSLWTALIVTRVDAAAADPGYTNRHLASPLFADAGAYITATVTTIVTTSNLSSWVADGVGTPSDLSVPLPLAGRKLACLNYDGVNLGVRVIGATDSGWVTTPYAAIGAGSLGQAVRLAANYSLSAKLDGAIEFFATSDDVKGSTVITNLATWVAANIGALS